MAVLPLWVTVINLMILPSSALESMSLGTVMGAAALEKVESLAPRQDETHGDSASAHGGQSEAGRAPTGTGRTGK